MSIHKQYLFIAFGLIMSTAIFLGLPNQVQASAAYAPNAVDTTPPVFAGSDPADSETDVFYRSNIIVHITDDDSGVDTDSFVLKLNGVPVDSSNVIHTGPSTDTLFTYDHPVNFPYSTTLTVDVDVKDLDGNVMPTETFSFTVMEEDLAPPVISNIQCVPNSTFLTISYNTDEDALGKIDYGETNALGQSISEPFATSTHVRQITGLSPQTEYFYKIFATDRSGNEGQSEILSCTTISGTTIQSDDFNTCELNDFWTYVNPLSDVTMTATGTQVEFDIPAGISHDVWTTGNDAPRIMQSANNTLFEIEAFFETGVTEKNQVQGMIIEEDADTFLRLNIRQSNIGNGLIEVYYINNGSDSLLARANVPSVDGPMYMRAWRSSLTEWKLFYTVDDPADTAHPGGIAFTQSLTVSKVGVFAGNVGGASAPAFTSVVDYFFRHDNPISPEDGVALEVGTAATPANAGSVTKSASCGNPVTLEAVAEPGWRFQSWTSLEGSATGTDNPLEVSFPFNEIVTANFVEAIYTIDTTVVDGMDGQTGGTITLSEAASEDGYIYEESVTITAVPSAGWQFDGWSGDLSGTEQSQIISITEDMSVTASFSRIPYTLDVSFNGQGSVVTDPASGPFYINDVVSVTATADTGWSFTSWGGDLSGSASVETILIDGNKAITANFTADEYTLSLSTDGTGTGSVSKSPDQASYTYGATVVLTAAADPGSSFDGWSGLGELQTSETVTLTMVQSESAIATFSQEFYTVTVGATVGGEIKITPPSNPAGYIYNEIVTVSALPDTDGGYVFDSWTGDLSGSTAPALLTMTGDKALGAVFTKSSDPTTTYKLTVTASAGGSVAPMSGDYPAGSNVDLTATAEEGFAFVNWTDASGTVLSTAEQWQVNMTSDITILANFEAIEAGEFTLTRQVSGSGTIISDPSSGSYPDGTQISLTAMPNEGWSFSNWSGDVLSSDASVALTIVKNSIVTATFTQNIYTVSTVVVGNGTAEASPPSSSDGYVFNEGVILTATPDSGWAFSSWTSSDGTIISDNPATIAVKDNVTFTATFVEISNTVTGVSFGNVGKGNVEASPLKTEYIKDEVITLKAIPQEGWYFVSWQMNVERLSGSDTDDTITVAATDGMNIQAIFEEIPATGDSGMTYLPFINN